MLSSVTHNISFLSACQDYILKSFESDPSTGNTRLCLERKSIAVANRYCPDCGSYMHIYDSDEVNLKDMPAVPRTTQIISVTVHRLRCPKCGKSVTEDIEFKEPGTLITRRAANWVRNFLNLNMSITAVKKITGIHWGTISKLHKNHMDKALEERAAELKAIGYKPKRLAVDEFAVHKGHTYATCVMDLDEGDIIWTGAGRTIKDFKQFFEDIDKDYLSEVLAVAMDMNAAYNILVTERMPHAEIVYDRYHFQALYGKSVLGAVRLEEAAKHKNASKQIADEIKESNDKEEIKMLRLRQADELTKYKQLKKSRWPLLMNSSNLSDSKATKLKGILENHEAVAICYAMKEEMCRLFTLTDETEATEGWINWFEAAKASGIPALEKFARQKEKRLPGLIAHAKHQISTGRLEGYNNKIKVAKRIGFGYRNDEYFFSLIKYLSLPVHRNQSPRNP